MNNKFMVFDVESLGLHGRSFAVGYVVVDLEGNELDADIACLAFDRASFVRDYFQEDYDWVKANVVPVLPEPNIHYTNELQDWFWNKWLRWKNEGAHLAADVPWPVEANFLSACVKAKPEQRNWEGPYPLLDISSMLLTVGIDPTQEFPREENELPAHNPLNDARQSARILIAALQKGHGFEPRTLN